MRSHSRTETCTIAGDFIEALMQNKHNRAVVVALNGTLGSGKTTFVQCVADILGVKENVTSPTFLIERAYPTGHAVFTHLVHIDTYRLEEEEEMEVLNWSELLEDSHTIIFVEWAEKIPSFLPESHHTITFSFVDDRTRDIDISYGD